MTLRFELGRVALLFELSRVTPFSESSRVTLLLERSRVTLFIESSRVTLLLELPHVTLFIEPSRVTLLLELSRVTLFIEPSRVTLLFKLSRVTLPLGLSRVTPPIEQGGLSSRATAETACRDPPVIRMCTPAGVQGCSHGWSAARRQPGEAEPVEPDAPRACPEGAEEAL
ncbi:MAG: hypothetical protein IPM64_11975 [Phycisphaerales bacterium]|nr:hypothetical protein [Phycisphaerales bacterium]